MSRPARFWFTGLLSKLKMDFRSPNLPYYYSEQVAINSWGNSWKYWKSKQTQNIITSKEGFSKICGQVTRFTHVSITYYAQIVLRKNKFLQNLYKGVKGNIWFSFPFSPYCFADDPLDNSYNLRYMSSVMWGKPDKKLQKKFGATTGGIYQLPKLE